MVRPTIVPATRAGWLRSRAQAYNAYRAAFANLPAIVNLHVQPVPLYGGTKGVIGFEHTIYITGQWHTGGGFFNLDEEPTGNTPGLANCSSTTFICGASNVFYLDVMGYGQLAAGRIAGSSNPLSPTYQYPPPTDPAAALQFNKQFGQVMNAIGFGIGAISAHETGHQLNLPQMNCSADNNPACTENYIYQNGSSDGSRHEWFYGNIPGEQIHWSQDAVCALEKYLIGRGYKDSNCK